MLITLPLGKSLDYLPLPFQRGAVVFYFRIYRLRHHPAEQRARHGQVWPLLLCAVHGWIASGGLGDVVSEALGDHKSSGFSPVFLAILASITGPISSESWNANVYSPRSGCTNWMCEPRCDLMLYPIL